MNLFYICHFNNQKTHSFFVNLVLAIICVCLVSCKYDEAPGPETMYPPEVAKIVVNKCANSGCHNTASSQAAGGLDASTWNKLFEGSNGGAVVIPYRSDFSTFCYYTNTDTSQGIVLQPTMPYNDEPLSDDEYILLKNWIQNGAPDKNGFVKFSDYQNNPKLYISNRGCDVVTVMDPASGLAMRYVDVGASPLIEGPSMIKVAPDKLHWYVIFGQGSTLQKFRTADNVKVGEITLGVGFWTSIAITSDSRKAYISDADFNGRIIYADVENMLIETTYQTGLVYPFGLCLNAANDVLYATSKEGNYIYKIDVTDPINPVISEVSLETGIPPSSGQILNPYSILLNEDETRYFVICNYSAELRVMQVSNDSLLSVYSTGSNPFEITHTPSYPYLFISCQGVPGTNKKSVIDVFNIATGVLIAEINAGHDSKGMAIDETSDKLFVANRNVSAGGPAAHHAPVCEGKNGYITAIDLNTLQMVPGFKAEISVDPYQIGK